MQEYKFCPAFFIWKRNVIDAKNIIYIRIVQIQAPITKLIALVFEGLKVPKKGSRSY